MCLLTPRNTKISDFDGVIKREVENMKVKVNVGEKIQSMACSNGQLRPGKGRK